MVPENPGKKDSVGDVRCKDQQGRQFIVAIVNVAHTDRIIKGLRFVFVELPKFQPETIAEKKMAVLWLRFLTEINRSTEEAPAELLENEDTRKALSIVEKSAMNDEQLLAYERFWMAVFDEESVLETRFNRGLQQGMAVGEAKGRAEERLANARSLKENGVPIDVIAKSLSLSEEEMKAI